jgi:nucleoside-diphosphate-sugar epimerase
MKVLLTGASGFIGRALSAQLNAAGHEVSALVRRAGSAPAGTTQVSGDLSDGASLRSALELVNPDCVVHLAAEIASQRDARRVREVNIEGTRRLLDACMAVTEGDLSLGPRIVFASTVVTGDAHGALLDERTPLPLGTPYGRSKQECERLVAASGLPFVIVRPSHVYGPGGWYEQELVRRLRAPGRLAVIGSGRNLWDVVHLDDVISVLKLAVERAEPGSTYHVVDDEPITYYDFMALTAEALGVGPPRRVPERVARLLAGSNAVDAVVRSARSSNVHLKSELGWAPRFPTARSGIPDALARMGSAD